MCLKFCFCQLSHEVDSAEVLGVNLHVHFTLAQYIPVCKHVVTDA